MESSMKEGRKLLDVLKAELAFVEGGGYSNHARFPWRPNFVFEDSPTCLRFGMKEEPLPCSECLLTEFIPEDRKKMAYPCRHIPLTPAGESVAHFYECGTEQELETALKGWLQRKIKELEAGNKGQASV
jgi:hypothetical protein